VSGRSLVSVLSVGAVLAGALLGGCAPVPRPQVMTDLDAVRAGASATEGRTYAPEAFARAEKLRAEAEAAFVAGDNAGSQLLAERSLAGYAHAQALARVARAEEQRVGGKVALAAAEADLAALDADQLRVAADADGLEQRLRVARDAQPIQPSGKASPEREQARLAAARALTAQAQLLCGAARLLAPAPSGAPQPADAGAVQLADAEAALAKLEAELSVSGGAPAAPIDGATRARAGCLAALTAIRRAATPVTRVPGLGDALLAEISAVGKLEPGRDDRGIAVTLRGVFGGGAALTPAGAARLAELGKIAAAHSTFPVEVVVHTDKPVSEREEPAQHARADAAAHALLKGAGQGDALPGQAGGPVRALALVAGNRAPVADPAGPDRGRNARLEIVFITPEGF